MGIRSSPDDAVKALNFRFDQHRLGYQFAHGELIRRDSAYTHVEITEPSLQLLNEPGFEGPHEEFQRAHRAYLKGNEKEAIRESLNALESTLKAICRKRNWTYDPHKDTASRLIAIVFEKDLIPAYLQQEFTSLRSMLEAGMPTLRNRAGGHGQGPEPIEVPRHLAAFALHSTGAAILLLIEAEKSLP